MDFEEEGRRRADLDGSDGAVLGEENAEGGFGYGGGEVADVDVGRERIARVEGAGEDRSVFASCKRVRKGEGVKETRRTCESSDRGTD